jgi:hypothetical protein
MATEIAEGGQATLDAIARLQDASLPLEDRYDASFTDHDPGEGQPGGPGGLTWWWEQFGKSFIDIERDVIETIATPTRMTQDAYGDEARLRVRRVLAAGEQAPARLRCRESVGDRP